MAEVSHLLFVFGGNRMWFQTYSARRSRLAGFESVSSSLRWTTSRLTGRTKLCLRQSWRLIGRMAMALRRKLDSKARRTYRCR